LTDISLDAFRGRLQSLKEDIARAKAHRDSIKARREAAERAVASLKYDAELQQKSSEVIKSWLDDMLRSNVDSIASLATSGLRHIVHDYELSFHIKQELKYNRVSMSFVIEDGGVEGDPMSSFGGGAVLVASLILRLAIMSRMNMGNLLLLDETMFALANRYIPAAADFMRKLSEETGVNIFMVTHNEEFMSNAHTAYEGFSVLAEEDSANKRVFRLRRRT